MPSSRIPSPARSQGAKSTPRRYKPRASRSVGSPACSNSSVKLTNIIQMKSFVLSPMPSRRSILTDTTDIDIPKRRSWWKKLDENSREIMEVLNSKEPAEANNAIEEYIDVDVLSQEKKDYAIDIPESSDGESISSIIIPQRKLFTQKDSKAQKKFAKIIDNRETLTTLHKTQGDDDKTLNIGRKNLLNLGTKQRSKPLFPSALLNISANKTANKSRELVGTDTKGQVKSLFGNRPGSKRKNMFADFVVSDSEDDIPELQPKIFELPKKAVQQRRQSLNSRSSRGTRPTSPTSSITDIEMDDWRLLPSSTMVDHQIEDGLKSTPNKRARLSKLSEAVQNNTESNTTANKTKQSNISFTSKSKSSKNLSRFKEMEINEVSPKSNNLESDKLVETNTSTIQNLKQILTEESLVNQKHIMIKNVTVVKNISEITDVLENKHLESSKNCNRTSKILSKIDQALQSDDDEDFTLVYENDNNDEDVAKENITIVGNESDKPEESRNINQHGLSKDISVTRKNKSNSQHITSQTSKMNNDRTGNQQNEKPDQENDIQSTNENTSMNKKLQEFSKLDNIEIGIVDIHLSQVVDIGQNSSKYNEINNCEERDKGNDLNDSHTTNKHKTSQERSYLNIRAINNEDVEDINDISNQKEDYVKENQNLDHEENDEYDAEVVEEEEEQNISAMEEDEDINDIQQNMSRSKEVSSEEEIQDLEEEGNKNEDDEKSDNQQDEQFDSCEEGKKTLNNFDVVSERSKINDEINNYEKEANDNQQYKDNTQNKKLIDEIERNEHVQVKNNVDQDNSHNITDFCKNVKHYVDEPKINKTPTNKEVNKTHDTTRKHKTEHNVVVPSPEAILHDKQSQIESFTMQGRNTSVRKTKSIIKNLTIRPSLAPVRESIDLSDGSSNFSAEGSGWDSHRTTRATLRQTFGKDFTPRKSLRALVMEKSAKRRTNFTEMNAENSRFPQANSTELPGSVPFAMDDFDVTQNINELGQEKPQNKSHSTNKVNDCGDDHQINDNNGKQELNKLDQKEPSRLDDEIKETNHDFSQKPDDTKDTQEFNESDDGPETNESDQNLSQGNDDPDTQKRNESVQIQEINSCDDGHELEASDHEFSHANNGFDDVHENNESEQKADASGQNMSHEIDEADEDSTINESNVKDIDESENIQDKNAFDNAHDIDGSDNVQEMDEFEDAQEMMESDHEVSCNDDDANVEQLDSDDEVSRNEDDTNVQKMESDHEISRNEDDGDVEEMESDNEVSHNEDDSNVEEMESDHEVSRNEDDAHVEELESDNEVSHNEDDTNVQKKESDYEISRNEDNANVEEPESDNEVSHYENDTKVQEMESDHEEARKTRQTTLEMYLQKVKKQNIERKKQLEDEIRSTLKAPTRDMINPFKVPAVPTLRRTKAQHTKPKAKQLKPSIIPVNMLPVEVLEDMKYKPPKRYRPANASWITKRLYKFLEAKLEPKYDYKARVRSEKLVETIYNFTKDIRRQNTAPSEAVDALKHEMARLDVVKTHFEFYEFFHEYMPREVRVKVVPDVFNKISLPRYGVFSDILR